MASRPSKRTTSVFQARMQQAFAPVAQLFGESSDQLMSELQSGEHELDGSRESKGHLARRPASTRSSRHLADADGGQRRAVIERHAVDEHRDPHRESQARSPSPASRIGGRSTGQRGGFRRVVGQRGVRSGSSRISAAFGIRRPMNRVTSPMITARPSSESKNSVSNDSRVRKWSSATPSMPAAARRVRRAGRRSACSSTARRGA